MTGKERDILYIDRRKENIVNFNFLAFLPSWWKRVFQFTSFTKENWICHSIH